MTSKRRSRVGRPKALTVGAVVDEAIALSDAAGLEGLSMPKLANRLGVGTMTLYGYIDDKQDLLDRMAERIFESLVVPAGADWRSELVGFFSEFRRLALEHPTLAGLLSSGRITIPAVFDILEAVVGTMVGDGYEPGVALRTFYAGLTYTIGFVVWEIPRTRLQSEEAYAGQWAQVLGDLDPETYPLLTSSFDGWAATVATDAQFRWGLDRVLDGSRM